jgi:hypothetical protein
MRLRLLAAARPRVPALRHARKQIHLAVAQLSAKGPLVNLTLPKTLGFLGHHVS